ncbi:MAG: MCE family protein [Paludibacteraceae bacterium]|nr:MCE family protein [Paludibacteraceae bacterium]MBQ1851132.1 MCE family protein [Paludibacteraceae bacterium]MBQ2065476.1 MCE family protein [Paludibacteraceae bacterium]
MAEQKKKFLNNETKIGIIVVIAIAVLYFGINFLKGINIFTPNTTLYVQYDRVDGIVKTSHVLINGYQVGHVSDIVFDYTKEAPITLELTVDRKLVVPKGTIAEVYETGMLGDKAIQLRLGKSSEICQKGDTIEGTITGGMLAQAMESLIPPIKEMIPTIDSTIQALKKVIESEHVENILANADDAVKSLKDASRKLDIMMDSDIKPFMSNANSMVAKLDKVAADVSDADLKKTFAELDATVANIKMATAKLNSTDNTLGLLLNDRKLYNDVDSILINGNALVVDLKQNPKRYVHFSVFGSKEKKTDEQKK